MWNSLLHLDNRKNYRRRYSQQLKCKTKRISKLHVKMKKGKKQLISARLKEMTYETSMHYDDMEIDGILVQNPTPKKKKKLNGTTTCKHCGIIGHTRKSHKNCLGNPTNAGHKGKFNMVVTVLL